MVKLTAHDSRSIFCDQGLLYRKQFGFSKDVAIFVDICGTFQGSSVDAEHGFSLMNYVKTKLHNRLEIDHLQMLMHIKFFITSGHAVDLE